MRIAIPTSDGQNISKHVALSKYFNIYENEQLISQIENPLIENLKDAPQLHSQGKRGLGAGRIIPQLLIGQNVDVFLAREIGEGMRGNLKQFGIRCIESEEKSIDEALKKLN